METYQGELFFPLNTFPLNVFKRISENQQDCLLAFYQQWVTQVGLFPVLEQVLLHFIRRIKCMTRFTLFKVLLRLISPNWENSFHHNFDTSLRGFSAQPHFVIP